MVHLPQVQVVQVAEVQVIQGGGLVVQEHQDKEMQVVLELQTHRMRLLVVAVQVLLEVLLVVAMAPVAAMELHHLSQVLR
jgi:predicted nucleic acid-binding protein